MGSPIAVAEMLELEIKLNEMGQISSSKSGATATLNSYLGESFLLLSNDTDCIDSFLKTTDTLSVGGNRRLIPLSEPSHYKYASASNGKTPLQPYPVAAPGGRSAEGYWTGVLSWGSSATNYTAERDQIDPLEPQKSGVHSNQRVEGSSPQILQKEASELLLRKVEESESECRNARREMEKFKSEYAARFSRMRRWLNSKEMQSQKTARVSSSDVTVRHASCQTSDPKGGVDLASNTSSNTSPTSDRDRIEQLEKIVGSLIGRLEHAKSETKTRDEKIRKYEKLLAQQQRSVSSNVGITSSTASNRGPPSSARHPSTATLETALHLTSHNRGGAASKPSGST